MATADPQIRILQEDLITLGIDPGPVDGLSGVKTRGAAHSAAQRYGLTDFTKTAIPQSLIAEIHQLAEMERNELAPPPNYLDLSDHSAAGWREGYRPLSDIVGFIPHQTGCPLTDISDAEVAYFKRYATFHPRETKGLMRWAKHNIAKPGDPPKYTSLKTHFGITYSGDILQIHPLGVWGWSAQGGSKNYINIELAGFFAGIEGDEKTRPGGSKEWETQSVRPAQIEACKVLIRYLHKYLTTRGAKLKFLKYHRQFTDDRGPDPGSKVVKEIGIPLSEELGLTDGGKGWVSGKGEPIPEAWDSRYKGVKY